jgi:uncharacterized protein YlaI
MAEVFGTQGQPVVETGAYACSQCGHRIDLKAGDTFPQDHHDGHPWMLMVRA